jgi:acetyltransferase
MCASLASDRIRRLDAGELGAYVRFARRLAPEDIRLRFGRPLRWNEDCARGLLMSGEVFAAFDAWGEIIGVARLVEGEIALSVRSDLKRHGIGERLLEHLIRHALEHGVTELSGHFLAENHPALALAHRAGFRLRGNFGSLLELRLCLP